MALAKFADFILDDAPGLYACVGCWVDEIDEDAGDRYHAEFAETPPGRPRLELTYRYIEKYLPSFLDKGWTLADYLALAPQDGTYAEGDGTSVNPADASILPG